jgi:hypothetical protein
VLFPAVVGTVALALAVDVTTAKRRQHED